MILKDVVWLLADLIHDHYDLWSSLVLLKPARKLHANAEEEDVLISKEVLLLPPMAINLCLCRMLAF